jgi:ubiquinone/menaquinone biosynthesis C-methylase UbiE
METPIYDTIGKGYNTTRRADPYLTARLYHLLAPVKDGVYLDIGCGTGNYLEALTNLGIQYYGVDPSATMLAEARKKNMDVPLLQAGAEDIPLPDNMFDGATATFTLHHWPDKVKGLAGVNRVLKPGAKLVLLSFTPLQMKGYWLNHYFPQMMQRSWELLPDIEGMERWLNQAGFDLVGTEKYFVQDDLQDHFLYSNKRRPEQYLRPEVRNGASSFTAFSTPEEVNSGLAQLETDITSGRIWDIIKQYENDNGDYLFFIAQKR